MDTIALPLITSILTFGIALLVWKTNRHRGPSTSLCLFACCVALWTAANGLVHSYGSTTWGPAFGRLAFLSGSLIPLCFFLFVTALPGSRANTSAAIFLRGFWLLCGTSFALLS